MELPAPNSPPLWTGTPQLLRAGGKAVPLFKVDPGWLFLIVGIVTIAVTVLIPAQHDLDIARWQRDRAAVIEKHRLERLEHYGKYLRSLDCGDETVVMSLAAVELNASPVDRVPLDPRPDPASMTASVFPQLEPEPAVLPPKPVVTSRSSILARWTTDDHTRLWMLAGGVLCILIGLLPPSTRPPAG